MFESIFRKTETIDKFINVTTLGDVYAILRLLDVEADVPLQLPATRELVLLRELGVDLVHEVLVVVEESDVVDIDHKMDSMVPPAHSEQSKVMHGLGESDLLQRVADFLVPCPGCRLGSI